MALVKEIRDESTGVLCMYWKCVKIVYDAERGSSLVEAHGWPSLWHYQQKKNPLMAKQWEIPTGAAPQLATGVEILMQASALSQPCFDGAKEVQ
jgi:hypothetical protein